MTTPLSLHWGATQEPHRGFSEGTAAEAVEERSVHGFTSGDTRGLQRLHPMLPTHGGSPLPHGGSSLPPVPSGLTATGHSLGSAASAGVPLGKPVCHMSKEELASLLLCSADAPHVLDALQRLSPAQLRPECFHSSRVSCAGVEGLEPVRLCCEREDARCRQGGQLTAGRGGDTPANTLLGSFVVEVVGAADCRCSEERCRCQRVKRTVCDCRGACKCGRWQLQSMQAVPSPSAPGGLLSLGRHQVVRETLRWVEYCDTRTLFVPGNYKMYSYYIDEKQAGPGALLALAGSLQSWVEGFVWRRRQGHGQKPSRLTLCQAFFDPPRKGVRRAVEPRRPRGTKRALVGQQTSEAPRPGGTEGRERAQQEGQAGVGAGQATEGLPRKADDFQAPDEVPLPPLKRLQVEGGGLDLNLSLGHQVDPPSPSAFPAQISAKGQGGWGSEPLLRETGGGSRSLVMEEIPAREHPPADREAAQPSASPEHGGGEPGASLGLTCREPSGVPSAAEPVEDVTQHLGLLAEVSQQLAGTAWAEGQAAESGDGAASCKGQDPSTSALGAGREGVGDERVGDEGARDEGARIEGVGDPGASEERVRSERVGDGGFGAEGEGEERVGGEGLGPALLRINAAKHPISPLPGLARQGLRAPRFLPPFVSPRQDLTNVLAAWAMKAERRQDTRPADIGGGDMGVASAGVGEAGVGDRRVGDVGEGNVGMGEVGAGGVGVGSVPPSGVRSASCNSNAVKSGVQSPSSLDLLVARPVPTQTEPPAGGAGTPVGATPSAPGTGCTEGATQSWVSASAPMTTLGVRTALAPLTASIPATAAAPTTMATPATASAPLTALSPLTASAPMSRAPALLDEERWRRLMAEAESEIAKLDQDCGGREARRLLGLLNQVTLLASKAAAFQLRGGGEGGGGGGGGGAGLAVVPGEVSAAPPSEVSPAAAVQPGPDQPQGSENQQVGPEGAVPCGRETSPPGEDCRVPLSARQAPHPAPDQAEGTHSLHARPTTARGEGAVPGSPSAPVSPQRASSPAGVPGAGSQHGPSQAAERCTDSGAGGAPTWDRPSDSPAARIGPSEDAPGGESGENQDWGPRAQPALGGPPDGVPTVDQMSSLVWDNIHDMLRMARSQNCLPSATDEAKGASPPSPDRVNERHQQQGAPSSLPAGTGDALGPVSDKGLADLVYSPDSPLLGATPIAADPEGIARHAGKACRAADAARAGAPGFQARKGEQFLGCFLALQQEKNEGKGDVQRKVCACPGSCEHGRWQRQGRISDIACATSDGREARFRKEMVRWHEWDARRARIFPEKPFVPTGYMMYTYSIEESVGGPTLLLGAPGNEELRAWVEKFQWSNNSTNNNSNSNSSDNNNSSNNETGKGGPRTRIVICQAFLSDPEKRKGAAVFEERRAKRQRAGDGQSDGTPGRSAPTPATVEGAGPCRPLSEDASSPAAVAGDGLKASALTLSIGPHTEAWKRPRRIMTRPSLHASSGE